MECTTIRYFKALREVPQNEMPNYYKNNGINKACAYGYSHLDLPSKDGYFHGIPRSIINEYLIRTECDIVSIGSGSGVYERHLRLTINAIWEGFVKKKFDNERQENLTDEELCKAMVEFEKEHPRPNVICVDPIKKTNFWEKGDLPGFSTVYELISKNPYLIGNCTVFISWPYPGIGSTYDISAIEQLKPKFIVILYEFNGESGSVFLREWIEKNGGLDYDIRNNIDTVSISKRPDFRPPNYHLYARFQVRYTTQHLFPTLDLFCQNGVEHPNVFKAPRYEFSP